jgi:hypothetical protein
MSFFFLCFAADRWSGLFRRALDDGGVGEVRRESSGQMGEKEEEKKGHL